MYNTQSSPTLTDCTFTGNSAGKDGGGMYNVFSSPTLTNCTFTGNSAGEDGGGMHNGGGGIYGRQQPDPDRLHVHEQLGHANGGGMYNGNTQQPDPD